MDLGLPGINGIEATKRLKQINNDVKVIILTSHNDVQEVLNCLKAGANAYCSKEKAEKIKTAIRSEYPNQTTATVLELLNHENELIKEYATFLFDNDYSLYTAKQWGVSPSEIDPSVLKRVPIRFDYKIGYFDERIEIEKLDELFEDF